MILNQTHYISGARSVDDRGSVSYVNDFDPSHFKRFYTIHNHSVGFIRAWHGHMNERKAIYVASGSAMIGAVQLSSTKMPSRDVQVTRTVLSEHNPGILLIPKGFANGIMTLTPNAVVIVFSDSSVEESRNDDYRYPYDYWDIWQIEQR